MLRKPKALLIKPSILEYTEVGRNIQTKKSTAKQIARARALLFPKVFVPLGIKKISL